MKQPSGQVHEAAEAAPVHHNQPARGSAPAVMIRSQMILLSDRHVQAMQLLANGCTTYEIARRLRTTEDAVEHIFSRLFSRLGATHRGHLIAIALRSRLIS